MNKIAVSLAVVSIGCILLTNTAKAFGCIDLDGASVFSQESPPVYLGFFGNPYATDSIENKYGKYGSQYEQFSIRNPYGPYGSEYAQFSATNPYAAAPPIIVGHQTPIALLTVNALLTPRVSLAEVDSICGTTNFFATGPDQAGSSGAFSIGPGITGNWYNPNQSGHGFSLEVLDGNILLAQWYAFSPQAPSAPVWIIGTGAITGDTAIVQAVQVGGAGARFPPNFNASQVSNQTWGTLTFTFTDCNAGHIHWTSSAPGYPPTGDLDLIRLTKPAGLTCP